MKPALKKTLAVIVSIVVFVLIAALAGILEGSEDPWLSVPVFRRVWLCR